MSRMVPMTTRPTEPPPQRLRLDDGRTLAWAEWGDADGLPAFFFHGGADSRLAAGVIDSPAREAGVRLIAPDRPGYGASDSHPSPSFVGWARDVHALADHLGLDGFSVIGHSAGGPNALAVAADPRGRVRAAVVVSGAAPREATGAGLGIPFRLNRWLAIRAPGLGRRFLASHRKSVYGDPDAFVRGWGRMSAPEGRLFASDPALARLVVADMREGYRQGIDAAAAENRALYRPWGFDLGAIQVPVALFYGSADPMAPPAWGRYLGRHIPRATLHLVPDGGHFSTLVDAAPAILGEVR
ncbi:MAG: alpha/beta hydrolase [Myxococcales bacterium]|nr:alpha/beta hydrolase [Myxococcales bacterium]